MSEKFIIGSRGSLLALTQTHWVKNQLEKNFPQISFEVKIIKTQGDQIQNIPLSEMNGKDFFTKELDSQLIHSKVDLVVHSGKDLGSDRPEQLCLGAIPKREIPHDVLLIRRDIKTKLLQNSYSQKEFRIGTSSPRRIYQIQSIKPYLPNPKQLQDVSIKDKFLRGNVDTRINKLINGEYEAIVLAAAGLQRLSLGSDGTKKLNEYALKLDLMFLPLSVFTPAPAQGALAIECRKDDERMKEILQSIEDQKTREDILKEKKIFKSYGGTCHLPLGIYSQDGYIKLSGQSEGKDIDRLETSSQEQDVLKPKNLFVGLSHDLKTNSTQNIISDHLIEKKADFEDINSSNHLFVATSHALSNLEKHIDPLKANVILAAGTSTHKNLAQKGYFCHASSYSDGEVGLRNIVNSHLFNIFYKDLKFKTLTHKDSVSSFGEVISSYTREVSKKVEKKWEESLKTCQHFFWMSYPQYETYVQRYPFIKQCRHYTGLGKTSRQFQDKNIEHQAIQTYKILLEN